MTRFSIHTFMALGSIISIVSGILTSFSPGLGYLKGTISAQTIVTIEYLPTKIQLYSYTYSPLLISFAGILTLIASIKRGGREPTLCLLATILGSLAIFSSLFEIGLEAFAYRGVETFTIYFPWIAYLTMLLGFLITFVCIIVRFRGPILTILAIPLLIPLILPIIPLYIYIASELQTATLIIANENLSSLIIYIYLVSRSCFWCTGFSCYLILLGGIISYTREQMPLGFIGELNLAFFLFLPFAAAIISFFILPHYSLLLIKPN